MSSSRLRGSGLFAMRYVTGVENEDERHGAPLESAHTPKITHSARD